MAYVLGVWHLLEYCPRNVVVCRECSYCVDGVGGHECDEVGVAFLLVMMYLDHTMDRALGTQLRLAPMAQLAIEGWLVILC